jgi:hypothetical protein
MAAGRTLLQGGAGIHTLSVMADGGCQPAMGHVDGAVLHNKTESIRPAIPQTRITANPACN